MTAEMTAEISRLHALFNLGKFDWRTTPTNLKWMNAMRGRETSVLSAALESGDDPAGIVVCEEELALVASMGLEEAAPPPALVPAYVPTAARASVSGAGVSDVYASMVAFDGAVGVSAASVLAQQPDGESCGDCGGEVQEGAGCSAEWCGCDGRSAMPPLRGPAVAGRILPAPLTETVAEPPSCDPAVAGRILPAARSTAPPPTEVVDGAASLVDRALTELAAFTPREAKLHAQWEHVHGEALRLRSGEWEEAGMPVPGRPVLDRSSLAPNGAGSLDPDGMLCVLRLAVLDAMDAYVAAVWGRPAPARPAVGSDAAPPTAATAYAVVQSGMRSVARAVPPHVPWVVLALVGGNLGKVAHAVARKCIISEVGAHLAGSSPLPHRPVARLHRQLPPLLASPLPSVVRCSYTTPCLNGLIRVGGSVPALPAPKAVSHSWAAGLRQGEWIVDSGAELMIAGSFIYPFSTVVLRGPDVQIKGVDGSLTQVDSVVRAMARLPDGDHCIQEILVCDSFDIALWSTEYMGCFGFSTLLMSSAEESVIATPAGCRVPLEHRPYRLMAPCRPPTACEQSSPPPPGAPVAANAVQLDAPPRVPRRAVTVEEAWALHRQLVHAGWRTVAETFSVTVPSMPRCDICEITKSKRRPQSGHDIKSTFAGQLTHSDTWGPFRSALYYSGCRYIVAFCDDYSRVKFAVFCKDRTTATLLEAYKMWYAFMSSLGCPPTGTWQSDGGLSMCPTMHLTSATTTLYNASCR